MEQALSYFLELHRETDFVLAFDGRSRKMRRALEDCLGSSGVSLGEMWFVYTAGQGRRFGNGATRKMFMGAQNGPRMYMVCVLKGHDNPSFMIIAQTMLRFKTNQMSLDQFFDNPDPLLTPAHRAPS